MHDKRPAAKNRRDGDREKEDLLSDFSRGGGDEFRQDVRLGASFSRNISGQGQAHGNAPKSCETGPENEGL